MHSADPQRAAHGRVAGAGEGAGGGGRGAGRYRHRQARRRGQERRRHSHLHTVASIVADPESGIRCLFSSWIWDPL